VRETMFRQGSGRRRNAQPGRTRDNQGENREFCFGSRR
jgi:hypothetical protein